MSRGTWMAVLLFVVSNAAWCAVWLGSDHRAHDETREVGERSARPRVRASGRTHDAEVAAGHLLPGEEETGVSLGGRGETIDGLGGDDPEATSGTTPEEAGQEAEARERHRAVREQATATLRKIAQVKDAAVRQEGIEELTQALSGEDALEVEYALGVLHRLRTLGLGLDLGAFRSLVLTHVDSESPGVRRSALYALRVTGSDGADFRLVLAAADDPDPLVRSHATRLLSAYSGGVLEGEPADAIVRLLADDDPQVRRGALRGFWGARVAPEVERALIEAAARPDERYDVVQHALSPLENKSRDVVDALFTHLQDDDRRIRQRSHWALQRGVREDVRPYVAQRYAAQLHDFLNPTTQREALQLIARHGDASLVGQLERFAENELVSARVRETARKAAAYLAREKPAR